MARIRSLKPEIHQDEAVGILTDAAYRLFTGLITQADDHGRQKGSSRLLASLIWPYQNKPVSEVEEHLTELEDVGLIIRYFHSGQPFIALPTWAEHQRVDNAGKTKIPSPEDADGKQPESQGSPDSRNFAANRREPPRLAAGEEGIKEGIKEQGVESAKIADAPLSALLADLIAKNTSRRPRPSKRWFDAERLLFSRDNRDPAEAERLLRWCQADEFWRGVILSMPKFREKYDQLLLHARRSQKKTASPGMENAHRLAERAKRREAERQAAA